MKRIAALIFVVTFIFSIPQALAFSFTENFDSWSSGIPSDWTELSNPTSYYSWRDGEYGGEITAGDRWAYGAFHGVEYSSGDSLSVIARVKFDHNLTGNDSGYLVLRMANAQFKGAYVFMYGHPTANEDPDLTTIRVNKISDFLSTNPEVWEILFKADVPFNANYHNFGFTLDADGLWQIYINDSFVGQFVDTQYSQFEIIHAGINNYGGWFTSVTLNSDPIPTTVSIDVKPNSCPNPINTKSKGVLPAAILGSQDLDVNDIDRASVRLEGVSPIRSNIEDVTTPEYDEECNEYGSDGFDDLTLKFKSKEIVNALGEVNDGDVLTLQLTGYLIDGTPIEGEDIIVIKKKR